MSFTQHLPRISGYLEALRLYKNTLPIRGREHIVPLRTDRRQPDRCWLCVSSVGTPHVVVGFYQTNQIIFFADGRIIVDLNWMHTRTTREFMDAVLGDSFASVDGYLTFNGIHICAGTSRVTLYRDAQGRLVLDDIDRGFPLYAGRAYAPRHKELGKRIALWRRQHRALTDSQPALTDSSQPDRRWLANNSSVWAIKLLQQPIVDGLLPVGWARMPPPSSAMTQKYRLYTTTTLTATARVVGVMTFKQLYASVKDGQIAVKD